MAKSKSKSVVTMTSGHLILSLVFTFFASCSKQEETGTRNNETVPEESKTVSKKTSPPYQKSIVVIGSTRGFAPAIVTDQDDEKFLLASATKLLGGSVFPLGVNSKQKFGRTEGVYHHKRPEINVFQWERNPEIGIEPVVPRNWKAGQYDVRLLTPNLPSLESELDSTGNPRNILFRDFEIRLKELPSTVTVASDGSLSLENPDLLKKNKIETAILLSDSDEIMGLVYLHDESNQVKVKSIAEITGKAFIGLRGDGIAIRAKIFNSDSDFERQTVSLQVFSEFEHGKNIRSMECLVAEASTTEVEEISSGVNRLKSKTGHPELLSSRFFENEDGSRDSSIDLGIKGRQGTIRFKGQIVWRTMDDEEGAFSPFEFLLGRYRNQPDTLEIVSSPDFKVTLYDPLPGEIGEANTLSPEGTISSIFAVQGGDLVGVQTDAGVLRFIDSASLSWKDELRIPVRKDGHVCGNAEKIFVFYPTDSVIERWNVSNGIREKSAILEIPGNILGIATSPILTHSPIVIPSSNNVYLVDPNTFKTTPMYLNRDDENPKKWHQGGDLRPKELAPPFLTDASGDGKAFSIAYRNQPQHDVDGFEIHVFKPTPVPEIFQIHTGRGLGLGSTGSYIYDRNNVSVQRSSSYNLTTTKLLIPDKSGSGLVCTIEEQNEAFIPPAGITSRVLAERNFGTDSRDPFPLSERNDIVDFGLSATAKMHSSQRTRFIGKHGLLVAVAEEGDLVHLYRHAIETEIESEEQLPILIGTPPEKIDTGEEFTYQIQSLREVTFTLLAGPPGASISESGVLSWTPTVASKDSVRFSIETITSNGESEVCEFDLEVERSQMMLARDGTGVVKLDSVPHIAFPLSGVPIRMFPGGSGRYMCILYADRPLLEVYETEDWSLFLSADLMSEDTVGVANHHSVYLYSSQQKTIERIPFADPRERARIEISGSIVGMGTGPYGKERPIVILERFDPKVLAEDSTRIGNRTITFQRTDGGGLLLDLLDPETLQTRKPSYSDQFLETLGQATGSGWQTFRTIPSDSTGDAMLLSRGFFRFLNGDEMNPDVHQTSIGQRDFASIVDGGGYFVNSSESVAFGSNERVRFENGPLLPIPGQELLALPQGGAEMIKIFRVDDPEPILTLENVKEFNSDRSNVAYDSVREDQRLYILPNQKRMITLNSAQDKIYLRELDLSALLNEFKRTP